MVSSSPPLEHSQMFGSSSKIQVLGAQQDQPQPDPLKDERLKVSLPRFIMVFLKALPGRRPSQQQQQQQAAAPQIDTSVFPPIRIVVDAIDSVQESGRPQPPPLPYRLTFKCKKSSRNMWSRNKTVTYVLGFRKTNIVVKVQMFESKMRRVFINDQEVANAMATEAEWSFSHFYTEDDEQVEIKQVRQGVLLKVIVQDNQSVSLLADGFPVEKLRKSPVSCKGSPAPPPLEKDVDTLDVREVMHLIHT